MYFPLDPQDLYCSESNKKESGLIKVFPFPENKNIFKVKK